MDKRIIRYAQLKPELGIPYSRVHIDRLESEGKWPKRFKLSEGGAFKAGQSSRGPTLWKGAR